MTVVFFGQEILWYCGIARSSTKRRTICSVMQLNWLESLFPQTLLKSQHAHLKAFKINLRQVASVLHLLYYCPCWEYVFFFTYISGFVQINCLQMPLYRLQLQCRFLGSLCFSSICCTWKTESISFFLTLGVAICRE